MSRSNVTQVRVTQDPKCFIPSANPRLASCLRCGKLSCRPKPDQPVKDPRTAERVAEVGAGLAPAGVSLAVTPPTVVPAPTHSPVANSTRPRDIPLERELTKLAAQAAGHQDDHGLRDFADARAWPGGVRDDLDFRREACEEAADLSSYAVWQVEAVYADAMAGVPEAIDRYEWGMRVLSKTVDLWRELLTDAA